MFFTLALWAIAAFIFFSDRRNKINRWFAYCYLAASLGTFKEFFIDKAAPVLAGIYPQVDTAVYMTVYCYVTAFLYLFSPLCFIILSMKFSDMDVNNRKAFYGIQLITVLIISIFAVIFPLARFKYFQLNSTAFWYSMSAYNIGYAVIGSAFMFINLKDEAAYEIRRRKRLIVKILLPPYYYCLVTIFIIHALDIDSLKKIWKSNIFIVAAVILFYVYTAYKEGFMGIKISFTRYDWNSEMQSANMSTQYINHMLKNHVTIVNW